MFHKAWTYQFTPIYSKILIQIGFIRLEGVQNNVLDGNMKINEFDIQSDFYVYF